MGSAQFHLCGSETDDDALQALKEHRARIFPSLNFFMEEQSYDRIDVRRRDILSSAIRAFKRGRFTGQNVLRVLFMGELAIDDGGPRREFLSRVVKDLISGEFFCGGISKLLPNSSQKFIDEKLFLFAGQIRDKIGEGLVTSRCHVTLRDASCVSLSMEAFSAAIDAFLNPSLPSSSPLRTRRMSK